MGLSSGKPSLAYRGVKRVVRLFYRPFEFEGLENLPPEPSVIVGNHSQMNGPLLMELYAPRQSVTWCVGEMMHLKEVPAYAFKDFWSNKPKGVRWLYKIASYLIAPLSVFLFNNASILPVYRDNRLLQTFKLSAEALKDGKDVVIYPECYTPRSNIIYDYQHGFVETALFYKRLTGKALSFVPIYICPALKKVLYGIPTVFDPDAPWRQEAERVRQYLMEQTEKLALSLPRHRVMPYPNMAKKDYPYSK